MFATTTERGLEWLCLHFSSSERLMGRMNAYLLPFSSELVGGSFFSSFFLVQHFLTTSCSQFLFFWLLSSCSIRSCAFCAQLLGPFFRQHLSMLQELGLSPLAIALWVWYCWWTLTEWFCFKGSKHPTGWWQGWIWLRWYLRGAVWEFSSLNPFFLWERPLIGFRMDMNKQQSTKIRLRRAHIEREGEPSRPKKTVGGLNGFVLVVMNEFTLK